MSPKDENAHGKADETRKRRLKQALRANLRRRKADSAPQAGETGISRRTELIGKKDAKR